MTTDFEVGNYHRKRGQGELRLSRLKWKDKIYAKNCVLKFRKSAARLYFFQWNHKENTPFLFDCCQYMKPWTKVKPC